LAEAYANRGVDGAKSGDKCVIVFMNWYLPNKCDQQLPLFVR